MVTVLLTLFEFLLRPSPILYIFLSRKYLEVYSSSEMEKLRKFVDRNMDGEDIVMNGVVSNYLRHSGIDLTPDCHSILIAGGRKDLRIPGQGRRSYSLLAVWCFTAIIVEMLKKARELHVSLYTSNEEVLK